MYSYEVTVASRVDGLVCTESSEFKTQVVENMSCIEEAVYEGYRLVNQYVEVDPVSEWVLWSVDEYRGGENDQTDSSN